MILSSINEVATEKGQSSPTGVREERVLAPVCCIAVVVVLMMVVGVLLDAMFRCGRWVRLRVDEGVHCIYITGREWKSGVLHGSGEKKVMYGLIFMHHHAFSLFIFK